MPQNKSVLICASGVVVLAAIAHLARPSCPVQNVEAKDRVIITDPQWGILENMQPKHSDQGELFEATKNTGRHRVLRSVSLSTAGTYQLAIETRYAGTSRMAVEMGGPHQPYNLVQVNLKDGTLQTEKGPVVAGVEHLNEPGAYRWWFNVDLNQGEFAYNFALLAWDAQHIFPGSGICKVILSKQGVTAQPAATP
jgi:hypothetical protein